MLRIIVFFLALATIQHAYAQKPKPQVGEITSLEWNILGRLSVAYAVGRSGQSIQVDCTVFNEEGKPVGGGFSFTAGGVATMTIEVPSKYQNTNKVTVNCTPVL